jgi:hypothetical protein
VSDAAIGRLFDRLAGPEGLTDHASTFTRPDVLVALGAGLAGVGRTELEELVDRFLAEQAVSVVADRALEERHWSTAELLAVEQQLVESATGRTDEQAVADRIRRAGEPPGGDASALRVQAQEDAGLDGRSGGDPPGSTGRVHCAAAGGRCDLNRKARSRRRANRSFQTSSALRPLTQFSAQTGVFGWAG